MRSISRSLLAAAGVTALAALAACGSPTQVQGTDVAAQVKSKVLAPKGITGATVRCPKETEAKKNAKVRCRVSDTEGNDATVTATITNEDGKFTTPKGDVSDMARAVVIKNAETEAAEEGAGALDCSDTEPKEGAVYICTTRIKGSGTGSVLVTQTDEKGDVEVTVRKRKLTTAKIESQIAAQYKKQVGISVTVDCPAKVESGVGKTFRCKVTNPANGRSQTIVATQTDEEGNFNLKVE